MTKEQLEALGLKEGATEIEITNALKVLNDSSKKILNKEQLTALGLAEDATPEQITEAISGLTDVEKITNALKKAGYKITNGGRGFVNEDDEDMGARCDALEKKIDSMLKAHEKLANVHQKLVDKYAAMENAATNAQAEAIVNKYKDRILNATPAVLEVWIERVKKDMAKGEEDLKALPVNKKMPELPIVNKLKDNELPTTALSFMAKVKNDLHKQGQKQYLMPSVTN